MDVVELCRRMRQMRGSDLHLVVGESPWVRVHGEMRPLDPRAAPITRPQMVEMMKQLTTDENIRRFAEKSEFDGAATIEEHRYRLNFQMGDAGSPEGRQPLISIRALDMTARSPESLGVPRQVVALCDQPNGLVLVTGPTGSGKSTTLASLVDHINKNRAITILTIEDPIEFVHKSQKALVRQREVGRDTDSFSEAIRHALRQDPDVILVGELRDLETMETAIRLAETGHLVFATLHTPDAPGAIDRMVDMFEASHHQQIRTLLAIALRGVVAQRLVPTADGQGRIAAFEVMLDSTAIKANIKEGRTDSLIQYMQPSEGMMTMERSLAELVKTGMITPEAARANSARPEELDDLLIQAVSSQQDKNKVATPARYSMRKSR